MSKIKDLTAHLETTDSFKACWNGFVSLNDAINPKQFNCFMSWKSIPLNPPDWFYTTKWFNFRPTTFDFKSEFKGIGGQGKFGYLKLVGKNLYVERTDNYHQAYELNSKILDFQAKLTGLDKKLGSLSILKRILQVRLNQFVHFVCKFLPTKSEYLIRLSRNLRTHLRNLKFGKAYASLNDLNLCGSNRIKNPFKQHKVRILALPAKPKWSVRLTVGLLKSKWLGKRRLKVKLALPSLAELDTRELEKAAKSVELNSSDLGHTSPELSSDE